MIERDHILAAATATATANGGSDGVVLVNGASLKPEPVRWLWLHWLALGKLHMLAGAPGQGKTTIALSFAAAISAGGRWPDGTRCPQGNVVIWSGEDDPADTLLPRLVAMGADSSRVYFVKAARVDGEEVPFDPARDLARLADEAKRIGDVRLLMVDPVVSAVGGDSNKNAEVRRALQPIVDLAAELDCAALGISHFGKGSAGRDPTERVLGSVAFSAVARVVMAAAKIKGDDGEEARLLVRSKSNIGPDDGGFRYAIDQAELSQYPGISASRVTWGDPVAGSARELLAEAEAEDDDGEKADAAAFLRELLSVGPLSVSEVKRQANDAGHAWRTVQRAMRKAGVDSRRVGFGKPAQWFLAASGATVAPSAPVSETGANGANGGANGETGDSCEVF
jgi:putative DNA primase/helicase